jgi:uncharacterized XkdX family phage protein
MSVYYKTVKRYYDKGLYTDEDVAVFVRTGKITKQEYTLITGMPYPEE